MEKGELLMNKKKFNNLCKIPKWAKGNDDINENVKTATAAEIRTKYGGIVDLLHGVLVRQVLDHRICPHCGGTFIPKDQTAEETADLLAVLFMKKTL